MLADWREIIGETSGAPTLEAALAILFGRVKNAVPVHAFAIHPGGVEPVGMSSGHRMTLRAPKVSAATRVRQHEYG